MQDSGHFAKRDSRGPRSDIASASMHGVVRWLVRVAARVPRHAGELLALVLCARVLTLLCRSGLQATESQDLGISPQEHKAMCAGPPAQLVDLRALLRAAQLEAVRRRGSGITIAAQVCVRLLVKVC